MSANDVKTLAGVAAYDPKTKNWLNWDFVPIKVKPSVPIQIFPHEDYNYESNNDIVIVKFANSIKQTVDPNEPTYNLMSPIDWPGNINDNRTTCFVTGWGNSTYMQKAFAYYIPQEECRSRLSSPAVLTEYV